MQLAVDFFSYFEATAPLLTSDPSLYCVSSWNDHGQDRFVKDPLRLYRSDFFPGLGWMLGRSTWDGFRQVLVLSCARQAFISVAQTWMLQETAILVNRISPDFS